MLAREIMTRPVIRVEPVTSVRAAITLLTEHCVSSLPVVDTDGRVVGIFTESDALRADDGAQLVRSLMTRPVEVVALDTDVAEIARRMLGDRLRSIPVVDDGVLAGIVSRRDILRPLVRQDDAILAQLSALLTDYSGHRDLWEIEVASGLVTITGKFSDEAEQRVVSALGRTVPGVLGVELRPLATRSHQAD